jgi:hypothetical protein
MALSRERVDDICHDLHENHGTTLSDVVLSALVNHPEHEHTKGLIARSSAIAFNMSAHPDADGELDKWAQSRTVTTCRTALDHLVRASRSKAWGATTSATAANIDVVERWSLRNTARQMRTYGEPLWNVLTGIFARPGVTINLDEAVGEETATHSEESRTANADVEGLDYEPTHKLESEGVNRGAEVIMIVSVSSSQRS